MLQQPKNETRKKRINANENKENCMGKAKKMCEKE